ncbi:MAG: FAD-dependent thymidylate synthase [Oscillospiraceae bacterium]|jgi:thymidylate synthase (FAD)|nr:FAD-dependent thymidylate synthase [Oscillospiraceae bacterium]
MKIIQPTFQVFPDLSGESALRKVERIARTCYKSEDKIEPDSAKKIVRALIRGQHFAMLEHVSLSVQFITQRSFTHELVRHRLCAFAQESQRYCAYEGEKFGGEVVFVAPSLLPEDSPAYRQWAQACAAAEQAYFALRAQGVKPEVAREVLPNSVKTEIWVTANLREWRHILALRALGTTGKPDPRMLELMPGLLKELQRVYPVFFDDLNA